MNYSRILLICVLFVFTACSKGGGSSPTPPTPPTPPPVVVIPEADIAFKIEIDGKEIDYTAINVSLSETQAINVNVTSTPFPKDGVTINVSVKKLDNSIVSTDSKAGTTAATNALTISNLVSNVECIGTVTVTSKTEDPVTKTYKSLIRTFRIARK
jgi:hypothetical protein